APPRPEAGGGADYSGGLHVRRHPRSVSRDRRAAHVRSAGDDRSGVQSSRDYGGRCCADRRARRGSGAGIGVSERGIADVLSDRAALAGVTIPGPLSSRLTVYFQILERWNRKINLTSLSDPNEAVDRLLLEPRAAGEH